MFILKIELFGMAFRVRKLTNSVFTIKALYPPLGSFQESAKPVGQVSARETTDKHPDNISYRLYGTPVKMEGCKGAGYLQE